MRHFRVTWRSVFDEVEADNAQAAKRAVLPEFKDYGATDADLKDFATQEICGGCRHAVCQCLADDASCDPE